MRRIAAWLLILTLIATGCSDEERVVLAAGTTLVDSGFIARVLDDYPAEVSVVGFSSLEALTLGASGSADVLITHLPDAEDAFVADHPGASQQPVFTSSFVLVGPPSPVGERPDILDALRSIAAAQRTFVARADGSGTAARERELWRLAEIDPSGEPWYTETGQGMGFTLQVADQRSAFTLAEVGAFVGIEGLSLRERGFDRSDDLLDNPYRITLVEGASASSAALFDWLTSESGRQAVLDANVELFGEVLYAPASP